MKILIYFFRLLSICVEYASGRTWNRISVISVRKGKFTRWFFDSYDKWPQLGSPSGRIRWKMDQKNYWKNNWPYFRNGLQKYFFYEWIVELEASEQKTALFFLTLWYDPAFNIKNGQVLANKKSKINLLLLVFWVHVVLFQRSDSKLQKIFLSSCGLEALKGSRSGAPNA